MPENYFQILNSLLDNKSNRLISDFSKLNNFITEKIMGEVSQNSPPELPEIYFDMKNEIDKFYNFVVFPKMRNKKIITLGGSFSSGKSSFINYLLDNRQILPYNIKPTTSVPTYILKNDSSKIYGINIFENVFNLRLKDLKIISHDFEDDNLKMKFDHLIKNLYVEVPYFPYDNLVFLDTPGYSNVELNKNAKSDFDISSYHYNSSEVLLWFVSSDVGSLTQNDINILKKINQNVTIIIIISKIDKISEDALLKVTKQIKKTLEENNIRAKEIFGFSKRKDFEDDFEKIEDFFANMDSAPDIGDYVKNFSYYFNRVENYYDEIQILENRRLFRVNNALMFLDEGESYDNIQYLKDEIKENLKKINETKLNFRNIKFEFFYELTEIAKKNKVEIGDIKNIEINISDFFGLISHYKEEFALKRDFEINRIVSDFAYDFYANAFVYEFTQKQNDIFEKLKKDVYVLDIADENIKFMNMNYKSIIESLVN